MVISHAGCFYRNLHSEQFPFTNQNQPRKQEDTKPRGTGWPLNRLASVADGIFPPEGRPDHSSVQPVVFRTVVYVCTSIMHTERHRENERARPLPDGIILLNPSEQRRNELLFTALHGRHGTTADEGIVMYTVVIRRDAK